jgi:hypothetical protein
MLAVERLDGDSWLDPQFTESRVDHDLPGQDFGDVLPLAGSSPDLDQVTRGDHDSSPLRDRAHPLMPQVAPTAADLPVSAFTGPLPPDRGSNPSASTR